MLSITNLTILVNGVAVLHNITVSLPIGSVSVLMGPNGSGKSSLAYAIAGHPRYIVTTGTINFNGGAVLLSMAPDERAKAGILLLPQYPIAIPGVTVRTFLCESYRALVDAQAKLEDIVGMMTNIFAMVGLGVGFADRALYDGFSGGEKKRLELAQGLLFNPKLFILDEIDSGLDIDAVCLVKKVITEMRIRNPQLTVLFITHYTRMVYNLQPHKVMIMSHGTIVAQGEMDLVRIIDTVWYDTYAQP